MFGSWRHNLNLARKAIAEGRLEKAVQIVRRDNLHQNKAGQRFIQSLVNQLLVRASRRTLDGKISLAWSDLSAADEISLPKDRKCVQQRLNELVELTIEQADSFLNTSRPDRALSMVRELQRRRIADRRADEIGKVAGAIVAAQSSAAQGDFKTAVRQLSLAKSLRPELSYLDAKLAEFDSQQHQAYQLTRQLKHDLLQSRWGNAKKISAQLLKLAPDYRVALDALKRCFGKSGSMDDAKNSIEFISEKRISRKTFTRSKHQSGSPIVETDVHVMDDENTELPKAGSSQDTNQGAKAGGAKDKLALPRAFLLWVDGAGGYLVCCDESVLIGQAVPQSQIDVPILGDLSRRHMKILSSAGEHVAYPLAPSTINGSDIVAPEILKQDQVIGLGVKNLTGRVEVQYSRPHPLASTGRLDLVSRHRIQPWADGIILMMDMIVIGPNSNSHIQCTEFDKEIVIFRRGDQLMCRCHDPIDINGVKKMGQQKIGMNSRISGENFSITLEEVTT